MHPRVQNWQQACRGHSSPVSRGHDPLPEQPAGECDDTGTGPPRCAAPLPGATGRDRPGHRRDRPVGHGGDQHPSDHRQRRQQHLAVLPRGLPGGAPGHRNTDPLSAASGHRRGHRLLCARRSGRSPGQPGWLDPAVGLRRQQHLLPCGLRTIPRSVLRAAGFRSAHSGGRACRRAVLLGPSTPWRWALGHDDAGLRIDFCARDHRAVRADSSTGSTLGCYGRFLPDR